MNRTLSRLHALQLDQVAYRLWRYNPVALFGLYAHHAFDRRFGVVTRGYGDLRYEPTPADALEKMLRALPIDPSEYTFIDIGSGKGKVALLASTYPFRRVVGVELYEEFHRIAVSNLEAFPAADRRCGSVELECVDAGDYELPREPCVVYLFNPFAEEILRKVLRNLEAHPGPLYVIFYAPILKRGAPWDRRRLFDRSRRLSVVKSERDFTMYGRKIGETKARPSEMALNFPTLLRL